MSTGNSALSIAISALHAQSYNLSLISTNLANANTVGYKDVEANFKTLITDAYSANSKGTGGVLVSTVQRVDAQGVTETAGTATYMAIDGNGFFVVATDSASDVMYYTRAGTFSPDSNGYLVNENGYYLQGWPVDADGNLDAGNNGSASGLEAVNVNSVTGSADATDNIEIDANLPADAAVGDIFTTASEIYDSLGVSHTITYSWHKTATNEWELTVSDPVMTSDSSITTGAMAGTPVTIQFDGNGNLISTVPDPVALTVTGWTTGATDSAVNLDLSDQGQLSQMASGEDNPQVSWTSVTQDGLEFGNLSGVYISDGGLVVATFDNGTSRPIYQIPLATFNNPNGLGAISGNAYVATIESGNYTLNTPGFGAAGTVSGYAVESSTVSTSDELTSMIIAQQAYSAAAQVISTDTDMFDALMSATR